MPWISFDLDGTLAAWPFDHAVLPVIRERHSSPAMEVAVAREGARRLASRDPASAHDLDAIFEVARVELGLERPFPSLLDLMAGVPLEPELVYPDARSALGRLRAAGWRVAVSTNGHSGYQGRILERLGLESDAMLTADTTGFVKPQAGFLMALPRLGGDPAALQGLVHVGDRLVEDVVTANRVGARSAWLWRRMPETLRAVPAAERHEQPGIGPTLEREMKAELEREGRYGVPHDGTPPHPDLIVADLKEFADLLLVGGLRPWVVGKTVGGGD